MQLSRVANLATSHLRQHVGVITTRSAPILSSKHSQRCYSKSSLYRPVYVAKNPKSIERTTGSFAQFRWANTSSGFYAPSTLTSRQRAATTNELRANSNVFEDSDHLPSLPVPNLENTLERLKETIWPITMNPAEFASALQLIGEFSGSAGQKLDLLLRHKANQTKNWLTQDWWLTEVYLKSRQPLVINSNPSMIYPEFPFDVNNQRALINTIAQLVSGLIDFKLALIHGHNPEANCMENEYRLDPNLCYDQYKNIFATTRLPGDHIDSLKINELKKDSLENEVFNIVISFKGRFFEVQLKDIENEKGRIEKISGILDKIVASIKDTDNLETDSQNGVGVLTTSTRDKWAETYKLLDYDSLESLKRAQFMVCLDTIPENPDQFTIPLIEAPNGSEQHHAALGRQILHADKANIGNRWFDKTIQLIVVADHNAERLLGAGINYEHSLAEGVVVTKMIEHSYDKTIQNQRDSASDNFFVKQQVQSQAPATFRQLRMVDGSNAEAIDECMRQAMRDFVSQVDQFDLSYLGYKQYGANAIKSWRFSPDSWFQVALQLAFQNLHKRFGSCYESASTRRFAYGRTETIRSLTKDVAQFCLDPNYDSMQAAIQSHKTYSVAANNGEAIDRVLMAYRMIFNELKTNSWSWGLPTEDELLTGTELDPAKGEQNFSLEDLFNEEELRIISSFFNNELIERSKRYALSTSQMASVHPDICMSYGPLVADGYGCCYNITGQQIVASITANSSNQSFSCEVHKLNESLRESLDTMADIVENQRSKSD